MAINIAELLGITYDEAIISNLIVGLINNSNEFKKSFLHHILEISNTGKYKVEARVREGTTIGFPDVVVTAESKEKVIVAFIECRLHYSSGHNKVLVYSDEVCIEEILPAYKIELGKRDMERKFIYLSMQKCENEYEYINKTFRDLVEKVWVEIEDSGLDRVYKDFCAKMLEVYSSSNCSDRDKLSEVLYKYEDNKSLVKFRELMLSMNYPNNLKIDLFWNSGNQEELKFITIISKNDWIGQEARWNGEVYEVNESTYDIHLETIFDVAENSIKLTVHYEPNPYICRKNLICHSTPKGFIAFERQRDLVKDFIKQELDLLDDSRITYYNGVNGIMYIKNYFNRETTIGEFKEEFIKYVDIFSKIVDKALILSNKI